MSDDTSRPAPVRQLRLVVQADDFEAAVAFYRDALGLTEEAAFEGEGDARVMILDAGRATLELANPAQVTMIDGIEAEGRPSVRMRVAFEVADAREGDRRSRRGRRDTRRRAPGDAVAVAELAARRPGRPAGHPVPGARRRLGCRLCRRNLA